ncbi:hypothetical protein [Bacillus taeanensis]|uniref:Uncharacterized protein n=1 Tax=Bacillus taeanensis TaxID=273032 RepID=A0A366XYD7_9BACI|nr:hypothetical protein [Bacillus taeanensis]RBW70155.1 hypothetical protein DS031_08165 [Bacillus taeanensis]
MKGYVLEEDVTLAKDLHHHCYYCLHRARLSFLLNRYDDAQDWIEQFQETKSDLLFLRERKLKHDVRKQKRLKFYRHSFLNQPFGLLDKFNE